MKPIDLRGTNPPPEWGVYIDVDAIGRLADTWADSVFDLPAFDYPGTPAARDEQSWFDYVTLAVSVLACLWPPEHDDVWQVEHQGVWLDDAPGIFAAFTRSLTDNGLDLGWLAQLDDTEGAALFNGRGTLQLVPQRVARLRAVAGALQQRWGGSSRNLVDQAGRDGTEIVRLLCETVPGYHDRPVLPGGIAHFDKLAHLAAALMAAGLGWSQAGFTGYDDFPVYPDYMLPRVFRHFGAMAYDAQLTAAVDGRRLIDADSLPEHAIRWATIRCGALLSEALADRGNPVAGPALDYHLWSIAVLGPNADDFGEHHRTLTLAY